jgi:predicted nucleotidyltransferase
VFRHVEGLPEHRRVLAAVFDFFRPQAPGAWVSGSVASGGMDAESDLDVGILFANEASREAAWARRWDWQIAPWFHRFDADHVRPYFVIYLFDPRVKTDIPLYTPGDLPAPAGGPYVLAWDDTGWLATWAARAVPGDEVPDWAPAVHEEERFWAWLVYSVQHVRRGEYYSIASDFWYLRDIVEQWQARLEGRPRFAIRRAERLGETRELAELFPRPERADLKRALLRLVDLHDRQRAQLELPWRTSEDGRRRIRRWVQEL